MIDFPTQIDEIKKRILRIDPIQYATSRNYSDGAVTHLSPYLSRGFLSTYQVYNHIKTLEITWEKSEKLIQELAWRDYWQQVWISRGDEINTDLKKQQEQVSNHQIPKAIIAAQTGIKVVDDAIIELNNTGYMHNHMRMYIASICCNIANSHWLEPSKWMYSELLDGDIASNQLSWQWIAGTFSNKKYYATQENINKYFHSNQKNTFLDIDYSEITEIKTPQFLVDSIPFNLQTDLTKTGQPQLIHNKKTLIYNYYNIDPKWHENEDVQRILLLEPSVFEKHPVKQKCIDFVLKLSLNIPNLNVVVCEFEEVLKLINTDLIVYKEHPLNKHYKGNQESREWLCSTTGYFPSFFSFWKKCKKEIRY